MSAAGFARFTPLVSTPDVPAHRLNASTPGSVPATGPIRAQGRSTLLRLVGSLTLTVVLAACGGDDDGADVGDGGTTPPVATQADLYVFGDSLSDVGNLGDIIPSSLPPPFFRNRISNGPVVVDYLAQSRGLTLEPSNYLSANEEGTNYATSGARANGSSPIDLEVEVQSFLLKNDGRADPGDNFIVFIGGNDILGAVGETNGEASLDAAVAEIGTAVRTLAAAGARNLFVFNAPDIGVTPKLISQNALTADGSAARGSALSVYFNTRLASEIAGIVIPGVTVTPVDVFAIFNEVLTNAAANGLTNLTEACYITDEFRFSAICNEGLLDSFAFFDSIHPSGKTHRLIGEAVVARLSGLLN